MKKLLLLLPLASMTAYAGGGTPPEGLDPDDNSGVGLNTPSLHIVFRYHGDTGELSDPRLYSGEGSESGEEEEFDDTKGRGNSGKPFELDESEDEKLPPKPPEEDLGVDDEELTLSSTLVKKSTPEQAVDFSATGWKKTGKALKSFKGLSGVETWGRWSDAQEVELQMAESFPRNFTLRLNAYAFVPNVGKAFKIQIGDGSVQLFTLMGQPEDRSFQFQTDGTQDTIKITVPEPKSPHSLDSAKPDERALGIYLRTLAIQPLSEEEDLVKSTPPSKSETKDESELVELQRKLLEAQLETERLRQRKEEKKQKKRDKKKDPVGRFIKNLKKGF